MRSKGKIRADSWLSEEFEVKAGTHQGSVLSSFLFGDVVDVFTKLARVDLLCKLCMLMI